MKEGLDMKRNMMPLFVILGLSIALVACGSGGGGGGGSATSPANVAFVTSTTYTANLGGIAGADAKCQARANAAGLPGTFKAWISDSTTDAYCHIHNLTGTKASKCGLSVLPVAAGPWVRTDGLPFAPAIGELTATSHVVYTPLNYDEFGHLFPTSTSYNFTNTDWNGVFSGGGGIFTACADWTDGASAASLANGGWVYGTTGLWGSGFGVACNANLPLICMQTGAGGPLPTVASTDKKAFVTSTTYTGNLGGLAGADTLCQTRAGAAGLANASKFKAWLSDATYDAVTRLSSNGPWSRIDGFRIANNKTDLTDGTLFNSISQDDQGNYTNAYVWTGTNANGTKAATTCNNWADGTAGQSGLFGFGGLANSYWTNYSATQCSNAYQLYCFEDQ